MRLLKGFADRTGLSRLLHAAGLAAPLANAVRFATDAETRRRSAILADDLRSNADAWRSLAHGLPVVDRPDVWMISSIAGPWGYRLESILALALRAENLGVEAVAVDADPWRRRYLDLVGVKRVHHFSSYLRNDADASTSEEFRREPTLARLLSLVYRRVDVGRIALSNYLYRHKFRKLDLADAATRSEIEMELGSVERNVRAAERLLAKRRPRLATVNEKGISPAAEVFGVCVAAGVPVIQMTNAQHSNDFMLKRYGFDNRQVHPFSLSPESWDAALRRPWGADMDRVVIEDLDREYKQGLWFNRKFLHTGKAIKPADEARRQLGLDPAKKTVVVFSHVLWDATFFYGRGLFEDYETWLVETVKAAAKNPKVNWLIKLHPDLVWKLRYEGAEGKLRDIPVINEAAGGLPPHVKIVLPDTDIDTFSFFGITDVCLTVRGTIGIEMACRGIPVVTAGSGRYSHLGFTIDPETPERYLDLLSRIETVGPMPDAQAQRARRYARTVFHDRPWRMSSFEMLEGSIDNPRHPLFHNIVPRVAGSEQLREMDDMRRLRRWLRSDATDFLWESGS